LIAAAENDPHLTREAIQAFEKIGPAAIEAIPFIEEALNHRAPIIQKAAHDTLIAIRSSSRDK
jgi:hypothetical protein